MGGVCATHFYKICYNLKMQKIILFIVIVGIVVNFLSLLDVFHWGQKKKPHVVAVDSGDKHQPSRKDKLMGFLLASAILLVFLTVSFSGWFVMIRDYIRLLW